jgi:hypothetical protein
LNADDNDKVFLLPLRIDETGESTLPEHAIQTNVNYENLIVLHGYTWERNNQQATLTLYWQVTEDELGDYSLFLHFWEDELFLELADQPPISRYPSRYWRKGQYLNAQYRLTIPPTANQLLLGFYDTEGERLRILDSDRVTKFEGIVVPLDSTN